MVLVLLVVGVFVLIASVFRAMGEVVVALIRYLVLPLAAILLICGILKYGL